VGDELGVAGDEGRVDVDRARIALSFFTMSAE
jgi:hypothetical protein